MTVAVVAVVLVLAVLGLAAATLGSRRRRTPSAAPITQAHRADRADRAEGAPTFRIIQRQGPVRSRPVASPRPAGRPRQPSRDVDFVLLRKERNVEARCLLTGSEVRGCTCDRHRHLA